MTSDDVRKQGEFVLSRATTLSGPSDLDCLAELVLEAIAAGACASPGAVAAAMLEVRREFKHMRGVAK